MSNTIKIKRGNKANLSSAGVVDGELKYTKDTKELFIGNGTTNEKIGGNPLDFPISTAQQNALDLKEDKANKVTSWSNTPNNTNYPSEKLVKDNLDLVNQALDLINGKIPSQASSSNQLADKDYVNSSIATNTATFKGTYNSTSELPLTNVDENDYAFVISVDIVGNTAYNRYKYVTGTGWAFEYTLNNSSFTAEQWATINSGMTLALKNQIIANQNAINGIKDGTNIDSFADVESALDDKADKSTTYTKTQVDNALANKQDKSNLVTAFGSTPSDTKYPSEKLVKDKLDEKQNVIDSTHKLSADNVDDTSTTHKFVSASEKQTWNGKQDAISDLATIRSGASKGATSVQKVNNVSPDANGNVTITLPTDTNQKIKVGNTTFGDNDVIEIKAGTNVTSVVADTTNKTITINVKDTTYESKRASSGGTDLSLVTTGEKATWNGKQNALTFDNTPTANSNNPVKSSGIKTYVDNAISNLPIPMQFKGTLGTNGTITSLPSASSSNNGFLYKVITAGTYASQSAKVGDVFISNGTSWVYVPSGDETFTDTWRNVKVNGTELLGNGISSGAVNFKNGGNVTVTGSGNDIQLGVASGYAIPTTSFLNILSELSGIVWNSSNIYNKGAIVVCYFPSQTGFFVSLIDNNNQEPDISQDTQQWARLTVGEFLNSMLIPNLSASKITSGTFDDARIPDLHASKITSGTIAPERLDISQNLNLFGDYTFQSQTNTSVTSKTNESIVFNVTNVAYSYITYIFTNLPIGTYTISFMLTGNIKFAIEADSQTTWYNNINSGFKEYTFNVTTNNQVVFSFGGIVGNNISITNIMLNKGSNALTYIPYIKTGSPVLLWQNPNPTASGGFSETTITMNNLPNYKYIILEWKNNYYSPASDYPHRFEKITNVVNNNNGTSIGFFGSDYYAQRYITIASSTQIRIETCNQVIFHTDRNTTTQLDNHCCIPIAIYGSNNL